MSTAESTAEVVGRHLQAFLAGDIEAIMADFAEDALLCTPDGALRGHGPIRGFFEWALPLLPSGATTVEVTQQIVDGDVFYVAWTASSPAVEIPFAVDVFIMRDGKLAYQCFGGQVLPKQS
jgi:ketosteroid isomerase-like protein